MLRDAKLGAFDVLLVWKFDRLARSVLTFERAVRGLTGCGRVTISAMPVGRKI